MFRLSILSDTSELSRVLEAKQIITSEAFYKYVESENYGADLNGIGIILMCREPQFKFKKRLRFSKKDKVLYMDIMLDFDKYILLSQTERVSAICNELLEKIPQTVNKYKFGDFDLDKFMTHLKTWFIQHDYI